MDKIDELLTRGVETIVPGKDELEKVLRSGKKLNIYNGVDPTGAKIHIGHAIPLRKLQSLIDLGHNVTFLIGDVTAFIGDTSDKNTERPQLTEEEIENNWQTYQRQAGKILDFSKVQIVHNSQWLSKLNVIDVIKLARHFSLNDFISRELIKKRLNEGGSVNLAEVLYPLMQGFDSYHLQTDLQIGGTEQIFNIQAGRTLIKDLDGRESFAMTNAILEGTDGRRMSKSWGNAIWIEDPPDEMFGKVMSLRDDLLIQYFTLGTNLPMDEIAQIGEELALGKNPMLIKKTLAHQMVKELHNEEEAEIAQEEWESKFQKKDLSSVPMEEIPVAVVVNNGETTMLDILSQSELIHITGSKAEAKRLIDNNAVEVNGQTVSRDEKVTIKPGDTLKIGKKRFFEFTK